MFKKKLENGSTIYMGKKIPKKIIKRESKDGLWIRVHNGKLTWGKNIHWVTTKLEARED